MSVVDPLAASGTPVAGSHCLSTAERSQERTGTGIDSLNVAVPLPGRSGAAALSGTPGELFPCLTKDLVGAQNHVSGRFVLERHDDLSAEDLFQRSPSFHQPSGPRQVIRGITKYCPSQLLDSGLVNDSAV